MSDLTDRYLAAIAGQLPAKKRRDIMAELRDLVLTRLEEREAELGRPLTRAEEEATLKALGHPYVIAGGYADHQYLIGPGVYPFYVFTLKLVLAIVAAVYFAGFMLAVIGAEGSPLEALDETLVRSLLVAVGAVTVVFWASERSGAARRMAGKWRPSRLPVAPRISGRNRFETAFEAAFATGLILWLVGVIDIPVIDLGPAIDLSLAPIWDTLKWPIVAFLAVQVAFDLFELARPAFGRTNAVLRILVNLAAMPIFAVLLRAGHWLEVTGTAPSIPIVQANMDRGMYYGIWVGVVIALIEIARSAWRLKRLQDNRPIAVAPRAA